MYNSNCRRVSDVSDPGERGFPETAMTGGRAGGARSPIHAGVGIWICLFTLAQSVLAQSSHGAAPAIVMMDALAGSAYTQTLAAAGTAPIEWSVTGGVLPGGRSPGPSSGMISGTPVVPGVFTFAAVSPGEETAPGQKIQWPDREGTS